MGRLAGREACYSPTGLKALILCLDFFEPILAGELRCLVRKCKILGSPSAFSGLGG